MVLPHVHVSAGVKRYAAAGYTSHLLAATVQFGIELLVLEVERPALRRVRVPEMYGVPVLTMDD